MSQSRFIRSVLSPAIQFWLRSLVTQAEALQVTIDAGDRQLLGGRIPRVSLRAEQVIYQGLHVSHLGLQANGIRVNLGQILRGQPVQLAEPVLAQMQIRVSAADLNRSLSSDLLSTALAQVAQQLLPHRESLQVQHIDLALGQISLLGQWQAQQQPVDISSFAAPQGSMNGSTHDSTQHNSTQHGPAKDDSAPATQQSAATLTAQLTAQDAMLHAHAVEIITGSSHPGALDGKIPTQRRSLPDQSFPLGETTLQQLTITADAIAAEAQITILP